MVISLVSPGPSCTAVVPSALPWRQARTSSRLMMRAAGAICSTPPSGTWPPATVTLCGAAKASANWPPCGGLLEHPVHGCRRQGRGEVSPFSVDDLAAQDRASVREVVLVFGG